VNGSLRTTAACSLLGSGLVLVAVARTWVSYDVAALAPLPGRRIEVRGTALAPGLAALGWLGLAAVAALAATRGWGRQLVGLVLAACGVGVIAMTAAVLADPAAAVRDASPEGAPDRFPVSLGGGPWGVVGGGVLLLLAGLVITARGRRWSGMGARYDAPGPESSAPVAATEAQVWQALDRGEDPTEEQPHTSGN